MTLSDGTTRELPSRHLLMRSPAGVPAVEHGYAMTAQLAQDHLPRVGLRRLAACAARTRFYVVDAEVSEEHHTAADNTADRFEAVSRRLGRSEAQRAGIESLAGKHAHTPYQGPARGISTPSQC